MIPQGYLFAPTIFPLLLYQSLIHRHTPPVFGVKLDYQLLRGKGHDFFGVDMSEIVNSHFLIELIINWTATAITHAVIPCIKPLPISKGFLVVAT